MRLVIGSLVILLCFSAVAVAASQPTPVVNVDGGQIQGVFEADGKVDVFKGIPYAAPPVGDLRWRPPQPVSAWQGVRDATKFAPICPQGDDNMDYFFKRLIEGQGMGWFRTWIAKTAMRFAPKEPENEDCLYLNVRTTNLNGSEKQPVMVWIHGGGHQAGSGSDNFYQSNSLPLRGVVLVTFNYRLGPLGYFAHPALSKESEHNVSGNYGTLDQIAALEWVRDNIAAFGGDPDNVTIFGESAGGESVADMMASPLARGLFHRAIIESGSTMDVLVHLKRPVLGYMSAEEAGEAFAAKVTGENDDPIKALRAMPPAELYAAYAKHPEFDSYKCPVIDGYVLPKSVLETFRDGEQAPVPLLVGSNSDEGTLGDDAEKLLELYPLTDDAKAFDVLSAVFGDSRFGATARYYAKSMSKVGQPAYLYFFKRVPPTPRQTIGAFHAAEIAFVFDKRVPLFPRDEQDGVIRQAMGDYWSRFAKTGDPDHEGAAAWPAFSEADERNMVFGPAIGAEPVERAAAYDIFERHWMRLLERIRVEEQ
jgi:para-nitrobenzyl esterase